MRPIEARSVSMPIAGVAPVVDTGLNGRSKVVKKPKSRSFTMTSRPSTGPTTQARSASRSAGRTSGQRDDDDALERDPHERAGCEMPRLVRERRAATHTSRRARTVSDGAPARAAISRRHGPGVAVGVPVAPQPPDVAAERLGEQCERADEGAPASGSGGSDVGCGDRQHDPLRRRDDLAPVARRQRRAHPRQQPSGDEERVARRADREHPRADRSGRRTR